MGMNKKLLLVAAAVSFLPIFRSGGREGLNFWSWIWNHTIWGPDVEYIPEEDYAKQIEEYAKLQDD